jgi:hypothetical protein
MSKQALREFLRNLFGGSFCVVSVRYVRASSIGPGLSGFREGPF